VVKTPPGDSSTILKKKKKKKTETARAFYTVAVWRAFHG